MDFFKKKWVQVTAWILWVISTVVLFLGGVSVEQVSDIVKLVALAIGGISAVIVAISALINKK